MGDKGTYVFPKGNYENQIMEAQITSEADIKENVHIPISDAIRQLLGQQNARLTQRHC